MGDGETVKECKGGREESGQSSTGEAGLAVSLCTPATGNHLRIHCFIIMVCRCVATVIQIYL